MGKFSYVFYDLDGTLSKSAPGITRSVQYALDSIGIHEPDLKKLEVFIGPPLFMSFKQFCGFDDEMSARMVDKYREYYDKKGVYETEMYDGMEGLLAKEKEAGQVLAICSSKPYPRVLEVLGHLGITSYFTKVIGAPQEEYNSPKGKTAEHKVTLLANALKQWHAELSETEKGLSMEEFKSRCIIVGDRKFDILAGKENGIATAGVTFGYGTREELEQYGAGFVADNAGQLGEYLMA